MTIFEKAIKAVNDKVLKKQGRSRPILYPPGSDLSNWVGEKIPCNVSLINKDLGGGFKTGAIHLVTGNPGAGKTALVSSVMKAGLEKDYNCIYVCMEPGLPDSTWLNVGLDPSKITLVSPHTAEDISEMTLDILRDLRDQNKERVIIVFDSINAFIPSNMINRMEEKGHDSAGMAERARALAVFLERVGGESLLTSQSMILIVAQKRVDIAARGAPTKIAGGMAVQYTPKTLLHLNSKFVKVEKTSNGIKYYMPTAIEVRYELEKNTAGGTLLESGKVVGNVPSAGAYIYTFPNDTYGGGIDDTAVLFEYAAAAGIQTKQNRYFAWVFEDETTFLSDVTKKDEAVEWLRSNTVLCAKIRNMMESPDSEEVIVEEAPEQESTEEQ